MDDFLALTLAGRLPHHFHGETAHFRWHWLDCGVLQLTPHARCERSLVLSAGIHGNETAPVEMTLLLLQQLFSGELPLHWRLWWRLSQHPLLLGGLGLLSVLVFAMLVLRSLRAVARRRLALRQKPKD